MSKKKIAIFATGWAAENLYQYVTGARKAVEQDSVDLYLFLCYPTFTDKNTHMKGEVNIFQLPHLEDFDGAMVFANGIDFPEVLGDINRRCLEAKIPVVYTGSDKQDGYFVGSDNYIGARALCDHLFEVHHVKRVVFIAGSHENMDSNTRQQALLDSAAAHGIEITEDDIAYTNWDLGEAARAVKARIAAKALPEMFVCANDKMAMVVCSVLQDYGYRVPEDLLVTGFDNELYAQIYDPSISSVDQRFDLLGKRSAETLIAAMQGVESEKKQMIACEFCPSESCGCMTARDFGAIRKALGKNKFLDNVNRALFDQNLSMMERVIMQGKCYKDLKESFAQIHRSFSEYHKNSFHVILEPAFEESVYQQDKQMREQGYSERMDAVFSAVGDSIVSDPSFASRKLVPQGTDDTQNHQFMFLPLHEEQINMGYIVFGDDFAKVRDDQFIRKYVERINIILGKYLRDLRVGVLTDRLLELTETDALTHVKNRTAYKSRIERIQNGIRTEEEFAFAVAVFDINNLKKINDGLGHEAGDEYIVNCCRLICNVFKKSAVYRIGGDEFAVILENDDYKNRDSLLDTMKGIMEESKYIKEAETEKISIASGLAAFDRTRDCQFADVFNRADALMYENKARMKKQ